MNISKIHIAKSALYFFSIIAILYCICMIGINLMQEENSITSPIANASQEDWDPMSYWHYPWGASGVHKGIDIFRPRNTIVTSPVSGIITSSGYGKLGGNYVYVLGPRMRLYYFAHMSSIKLQQSLFIKKGSILGFVGNTGNAKGKRPHLHFSIFSYVPIIKYYDKYEFQGWKKMFYLKPQYSMTFSTIKIK